MPKKTRLDSKTITLKQSGTLHRRPEKVIDSRFAEARFFDARDLLQVKYEMLRRVDVDGDSVTEAATAFGFSRPAFYDAQHAFKRDGLAGLMPQRPGPRRAHKLSDEVMGFVERLLEEDPARKTSDLLLAIKERFGIEVHRRSVERAKRRRVKKTL
jgi:transposase